MIPQLAPPGCDIDPAVIQETFRDAARRVSSGWISREDFFSSERQRAKRWGAVYGRDYTAYPNWQGRDVIVDSNGRVHFWWKDGERDVNIFIPGSKSLIPREAGERRFLSFTSIGISVVDDDHQVLLRKSPGAPLDVTWNKANIGMMMQATDIIRCWEFHLPEETWKDEGAQEVVDTTAHPPEFYEPVGLPPLRQKQKAAKYPAPPRPGDGTWIVNEFLNSFLGDTGGRLFAANIDLWPEPEYRAEHARIQLKAFLENPKYLHYPHRQRWLAILGSAESIDTLHLRANIVFCRTIETKQIVNYVGESAKGKAVNRAGAWWLIGPRKPGW